MANYEDETVALSERIWDFDWPLSPEGEKYPTIADNVRERLARRKRFIEANPDQSLLNRSETVAFSDDSGVRRSRGAYHQPRPGHDLVADLGRIIPPRPRVSHNPRLYGTKIARSRRDALKHPHLQVNGPRSHTFILADIDHSDAVKRIEQSGCAPPNWIQVNRENGHAHCAWVLKTPVLAFETSSQKALRYLASVRRAYSNRVSGDPGYCGLLTKNPLSGAWETAAWRDDPYELGELADPLSREEMRYRRADLDASTELGRNCEFFERASEQTYPIVVPHKREGGTKLQLLAVVQDMVLGMSDARPDPLPFNECRHIAKSIVEWTWPRFTVASLSKRQSFLGKRGNAKRWDGHVKQEPWKALGISKPTYYRRKKAGKL